VYVHSWEESFACEFGDIGVLELVRAGERRLIKAVVARLIAPKE
jgi:hypothetical protein